MYEEYYRFARTPFSLTPDPRFLYRSESHDIALQQVWQAIRRREGFIVLTGDIGTGKTTLCRTLLEQFDETTFSALILNPFLNVEELLRELLVSFGVATKEALMTGRLASASKHELVHGLSTFLLSLVPIKGRAVLIIDEAQNLSPEVLEEIRILSNLETSEQKLLQIVLAGQLNLLDVLHDAKLRQLDQRISIRCLLKPLNREHVEAYIGHRLWIAHGSTTVAFSPAALDLITETSGGVPRVINLICDRALMAGARAETEFIEPPLVLEAIGELGLAASRMGRWRNTVRRAAAHRTTMAVAAAVAIVALAMLAYGWTVYGDAFSRLLPRDMPRPVVAPTTPPQPRALTVPQPPQAIPSLTPPPLVDGAFSVLVGTYETPQEAEAAVTALRTKQLPVYAIDLPAPDGRMTRRLLVGRYITREQALTVQRLLAANFPSARIITSFQERLP